MPHPDAEPPDGLQTRGGISGGIGCDWWTTLVRVPGRSGPADLDEIVDRLVSLGVVGEHRRDVGAEVLAGSVPVPAGRWALLVAFPGLPWAGLTPSNRDTPGGLARRSGLRVLGAGWHDVAGDTWFQVFEGAETLVDYHACAALGSTTFDAGRLPADWLDRLGPGDDPQAALAREFDAFVPYLVARDDGDAIRLYGYFGHHEFGPEDYARVDLLGFGPARLVPTAAGRRLRAAIEGADIPAIRAAVAAGADLRALPSTADSALAYALRWYRFRIAGGARPRKLIAALLDLGADPDDPDGEAPAFAALDALGRDDPAEAIAVLDLLIARGATLDAPARAEAVRGRTPLHLAARRGRLPLARFLVARGADPHAVDAAGLTPRRFVEHHRAELRESGLFDGEDDAPDPAEAAMLAFLADAEVARDASNRRAGS